jgi:hypothetical protein
MQIESVFTPVVKFFQSVFGKGPKAFDAVDVVFAFGKFIGSVANAMVFFIAQIDQAVLGGPTVTMDDRFQGKFTPNDPL